MKNRIASKTKDDVSGRYNQRIFIEDDYIDIHGFKTHKVRDIFIRILIIISGGTLVLLFHWKPLWKLKVTNVITQLETCDKVLIKDKYGQHFIENIKIQIKHHRNCKLTPIYPDEFYWNIPQISCTKERLLTPIKNGFKEVDVVRYFFNKMIKYMWIAEKKRFRALTSIESTIDLEELIRMEEIDTSDENSRKILFGPNSFITYQQSLLILFLRQLITPFPIYQLFCNVMYVWHEYYFFMALIDVMTLVSLFYNAWKEKQVQKQIKDNIRPPIIVNVRRKVKDRLVPGDLLNIPKGGYEFMPCDALLLSGQCVVSEAMLTGESMPNYKIPVKLLEANEMFNPRKDSKHLLLGGCKIVQTELESGRNYIECVVMRTGFNTLNGDRIRYIIYPKPTVFKFTRDIKFYIICLATLASIGVIFKITINLLKSSYEMSEFIIIWDSLDLLITAVSPALPACLAIGIAIAYNRLRKESILVLNTNAIAVSGAINAIIFDKTGTLTENDIEILGIIDIDNSTMKFNDKVKFPDKLEFDSFLKALVTCHTLSNVDNILIGDPLDIKMFESTRWRIKDYKLSKSDIRIILKPAKDDNNKTSIGVVHRFPFESELQRMSIICNVYGTDYFEVYCKGSPEKLHDMCVPHSIPENYHKEYESHAAQGYRILAFAFKYLDDYKLADMESVKELSRELIECNLWFLGFLIMDNPLKKETIPIIQDLSKIKMRMAIATGDGMHTTISIAKQCGLIKRNEKVIIIEAEGGPGKSQEIRYTRDTSQESEIVERIEHSRGGTTEYFENECPDEYAYTLAITGESFEMVRKYFPDIIPKLMVKGGIFSRMFPEQKAQLIEGMKEMQYYVAMCGDGSNDCRALKEAHAGISLSAAETSISANFISNTPNIKAVKVILREGRAALSTSFGVFQYVAVYSFVQLVSVLLLSWNESDFSITQYLFLDLLQLIILIDLSSISPTQIELSPSYPEVSLFGFIPFLSLLIYVMLNSSIQVAVLELTTLQNWWLIHAPFYRKDFTCYEQTAVFTMITYQYVYLIIAYFEGKPHRQPMHKNYALITYILVLIAFIIFLTLANETVMHKWLYYRTFPSKVYRLQVFGAALFNGFLMIIAKKIIIEYFLQNFKNNCINKVYLRYEKMEEELKRLVKWPPVTQDVKSIPATTLRELNSAELPNIPRGTIIA
ncbi:unnamed protein product [Gordionus sp. m RMFG-2023]